MTTAARGRRRRAPAFDLDAYQRELETFGSARGEARYAALTGGPALVTAPLYEQHASLFGRDAVEALARLRDGDGGEARQAAALLPFAAEGNVESQVAELTDRIAAAEASAVVIWRGERIAYATVPSRIAEISERSERNALDASYREAVEAINPLREERLDGLRRAWQALGHADPFGFVASTQGIDLQAITGQMDRFLVESETPYFAALRRFLAEIDIEQGDASIADLWHVLRGAGWDAWFTERQLPAVVGETLGNMGIDLGAQSNLRLEMQSDEGAPFAATVPVSVPGDVRVVFRAGGGHADYRALLGAVGRAEADAHASTDAPASYRYAGDDSVGEAYAWMFGNLTLEADWLTTELRMSEDEIVSWLDFAAFRMLHDMRRIIASVSYQRRLHGPGGTALHRAYYSGTLSLLTGVRHPESSYLADVPMHLGDVGRFRGWCLGTTLGDRQRQQHGASWWRNPAAVAELTRGWRRGRELNADALVAHVGYDRLDWRPILRQIRTQLIGEMSGYGGPNITTRAGTRKV